MNFESCSDCYLERIEQRWNQVLLNWVNKCILTEEEEEITYRNLMKAIIKYSDDVSSDDFNKITLTPENFELFIKKQYPILKLSSDMDKEDDNSKKLYLSTSILLYYLCTNSKNSLVDADIRRHLLRDDQMMILLFCEALAEMEVTINNIELATKAACENYLKQEENIATKDAKQNDSELDHMTSSSDDFQRDPILKFKSSITVMPSVVTDKSLSRSSEERFTDESDYNIRYLSTKTDREIGVSVLINNIDVQGTGIQRKNSDNSVLEDSDHYCQPECACTKCSSEGPCCGDVGCTRDLCDDPPKVTDKKKCCVYWKYYFIIGSVILLSLVILLSTLTVWLKKDTSLHAEEKLIEQSDQNNFDWAWICRNSFCKRVYHPFLNVSVYPSLSRCTLLCTGLQIWPYPIGYTYNSKTIIAVATNNLEYKFKSVPSAKVQEYLSGAFKLFLKDLARLEKSGKSKRENYDLSVKKMNIQIEIESDSDPRLRLNTDESYTLNLETNQNEIIIKIVSDSFCGVRNGLETLSQLFLFDQSIGSLITFSNIVIKDAPTYKYRGLMIDTARNFIPVLDLMRTIDGMSSCKLNTFHWRISDVTSFPLYLNKVPIFSEYGPYDKSMVYTRDDVKLLVKRAGIRGIRILIEVAAPGPVGRPWSWLQETTCPRKNNNFTCDNILCLRLSMKEPVFDILQKIYTEIIELTQVDDIFHISNSIFLFNNCYNLMADRDGYLDKALARLKIANKGFLPRLPIIWYSSHLHRDYETWNRFGVQLNEWDQNLSNENLNKFKVIHSSKWDLSCEMKNERCTKYRSWQQMYAWTSWRNVDAFTIEGGESILWTDIVDSTNLDYHVWPRAAAVAERLWSDMVANSTANKSVYLRLDTQRWRMLLRGVNVQPIWPAWCSYNPSPCLQKVQ
ncbi:unnamed protein product [Euphydryas editha]|uniref:beta-N-acetylhexosaminidase n=1 Tax=Euphydryas editha TaxID=104508 RepID=A0AAU9UHJ1_EUPED|nr:unnamed protein product [Euphydryas editha]